MSQNSNMYLLGNRVHLYAKSLLVIILRDDLLMQPSKVQCCTSKRHHSILKITSQSRVSQSYQMTE